MKKIYILYKKLIVDLLLKGYYDINERDGENDIR